jgi:predicted dehydrogenase
MMNQSIHVVDMVQWLAGATMANLTPDQNPVEEVFAYTAKRAHDPNLLEVEDTATVALRFRDGTLGQLLGTTSMYPGTLRRVQIGGRDGMAETLEDELITWQFRNPTDEDERIRSEFGQQSETTGGASDPMAIDYANHRRNIAAFIEAMEQGSGFMLDGREARKPVAILEALYQSAASGKPEKVR